MIDINNIFRHELIGLNMEIVNSSNDSLIGLYGKIVDESKKTFSLEVSSDLSKNKKIKIIPKYVVIMNIFLPNGEIVEINGKILVSRPEDRIKKKFKKI
ncbi:MAG: ribonuclease P protein subunit [Methanobrevibacter sp.]|nr:ribonuclease P protein subunit [Methanobrevibacter sp.]